LVVEQRGLEEKDWDRYDMALSSGDVESVGFEGTHTVAELSPEEKAELDRKRKLAYNAPKRISKIEQLIEKAEQTIAEIDEEMMKCGSDVESLIKLTEQKAEEEKCVATLMEEWETLEEIVAEIGE
jgi:hypothetical protein